MAVPFCPVGWKQADFWDPSASPCSGMGPVMGGEEVQEMQTAWVSRPRSGALAETPCLPRASNFKHPAGSERGLPSVQTIEKAHRDVSQGKTERLQQVLNHIQQMNRVQLFLCEDPRQVQHEGEVRGDVRQKHHLFVDPVADLIGSESKRAVRTDKRRDQFTFDGQVQEYGSPPPRRKRKCQAEKERRVVLCPASWAWRFRPRFFDTSVWSDGENPRPPAASNHSLFWH